MFVAIADFLARNPDQISQIGVVYQFRLTGPDSVWTVDIKNGKGGVSEGETTKPECTLTLSDADFMGMTDGDLDPQALFFEGKLKVSGNVMASQKLIFLQKIDPMQAKEAVLKARSDKASLGTASGAKAKTAAPKKAVAPEFFEKLAALVKNDASVAKSVGARMQWVITEPVAHYALNFKDGASVQEGELEDPDVCFTISDENLAFLASGELSLQSLYQHGKLRIDGDLNVAQRLTFISTLG